MNRVLLLKVSVQLPYAIINLTTLVDCGTMLVMVLAHAKKSGDGSLLQRHVSMMTFPTCITTKYSSKVPSVEEMGRFFD